MIIRSFDDVPVFEPLQGTPGAQTTAVPGSAEEATGGAVVEVEIFGLGFRTSGKIQPGRFDRLSGWINVQSGFIAVRDASDVPRRPADGAIRGASKGTLWVRLSQVALIGERSGARAPHPGTPIVEKLQRRVLMTAPGYRLEGDLHIHAHGSMAQMLGAPDPRFLPLTDVVIRDLSNASAVARFQFALVNREQLVTIVDEPLPYVEVAETEVRSA